jgi:hypothetical protein
MRKGEVQDKQLLAFPQFRIPGKRWAHRRRIDGNKTRTECMYLSYICALLPNSKWSAMSIKGKVSELLCFIRGRWGGVDVGIN